MFQYLVILNVETLFFIIILFSPNYQNWQKLLWRFGTRCKGMKASVDWKDVLWLQTSHPCTYTYSCVHLGIRVEKERKRNVLDQWFSNCGSWTSSISITRETISSEKSQIASRTYWVRDWGCAQQSGSHQPSRWFWGMLRLEIHFSRV